MLLINNIRDVGILASSYYRVFRITANILLNRIIPSGKIYSDEVLIISSFRHEKRENHVEKIQARYTDGAKDTSELGKKQRSLLFH